MKLTEEEKKMILEEREKREKRKEMERMEKERIPIKTGILKHDLFQIGFKTILKNIIDDNRYAILTKKELDGIIKRVNEGLLDSLLATKGTTFYCYNVDGFEHWHSDSDGGDLEEMSSEWAWNNLKHIKPISG